MQLVGWKTILDGMNKNRFGFSLLVLSATFVFTRLPFFLWAKLVGLNPDTLSYNEPVYQLLKLHRFPDFDILPPGYSLFLVLMNLLGLSNLSIVMVQSLIHFAAFVFLLYAFNCFYPTKVFYVLLGILASLITTYDISYETYIGTESLYASVLVACAACTILAFNSIRILPWLLLSAFMSLAFFIRPTGLMMLPIAAFIFVYLIVNKKPMRISIALLSIIVLVIAGRYAYSKSFNQKPIIPSERGGVTLFTVPVYFIIRPHETFPDSINKLIDRYTSRFNPKDMEVIDHSWNIPALWGSFTNTLRDSYRVTDTLTIQEYKTLHSSVWYKEIGLNKSGYLKYCIAMIYGCYIDLSYESPQFYFSILPVRYEMYYQKNYLINMKGDIQAKIPDDTFKSFALKEFFRADLPGFNMDMFTFSKSHNFYLKLYHLVYKLHRYLFKNILWLIAFIVLLPWVAVHCLKDPYSLFLAFLASMSIITSLIVCLSQYAHSRYAYPTTFSIYLFVILGVEHFIRSRTQTDKE